jgi:sulfoquinovose isomerase
MAISPAPWRTLASHRDWLMGEAHRLFDFYQFNVVNRAGGFFDLDGDGHPASLRRELHLTTRMVHCFAIGHLLGRPGSTDLVDHGMAYLWHAHRDETNGGYMWSLDDDGPVDASKQAYGHGFVLLAASAAKVVGHPDADRLITDITEVIETHFWEQRHSAMAEEFARDWQPISGYRGQNSNMHSTEALMAAFEATGDENYLRKAESIADLVINRCAAALGYRVGEHFDSDWQLDRDYHGGDIFRPAGTTPGHWLEWSRLLLQLWELGGRKLSWLPPAAAKLFRNAIDLGWDTEKGGFHYTLDWDNRPALRQKLWWPACEAIGAAHFLGSHADDPYCETWYRRVWDFCNLHYIDHRRGGWIHEVGDNLRPSHTFFAGKPDLYHALQACLIPLYPATGSLTRGIAGTS